MLRPYYGNPQAGNWYNIIYILKVVQTNGRFEYDRGIVKICFHIILLRINTTVNEVVLTV